MPPICLRTLHETNKAEELLHSMAEFEKFCRKLWGEYKTH